MVFWVVAGVLTFGTILLLLWPVLSASADESESGPESDEALAVYRDQLKELERDLEAGRLANEDFEAAKIEVQRRMLAAASGDEESAVGSAAAIRKRRLAAAVLVIFFLPAGALLSYVSVGRPGMPDRPLALRTDGAGTAPLARSAQPAAAPQSAAAQPGVSDMVSGLEEKLKANPQDADGWALLGRSYMVTERYRDAVSAYGKAIELVPDNLQLRAARGEALVLAADGMVPPGAVDDFRAVNLAQPEEPRSRYYLGLARSQAADLVGALKWWIALEADTPPGAPWEALVTQRIDDVGTEAGIDVAALRAAEAEKNPRPAPMDAARAPTASAPGPTREDVEAAQDMSAEDRSAMIQSMVERLAGRLEEEPDDLEGWTRLARAYDVLGRSEDALKAHANAARLAPEDLQLQLNYARALFPPGTPESGITGAFVELVGHIRKIAPDSPDGLFYGGLVAAHEGDAATAKRLWSALLEKMGPNAPARGMLEQRIKALGG
ncbi:c-type cytochrome biogenesis protein CcmI [Nisaea acidiphila]|uniref:C-type cytochrome biogenesis protein CcmI n=1 Tax=Nisaea acidiphila TaxID=1862145 RepID=A0A9J7AUN0_9PROT|nr:c-type cytochrome biogenesis protein CcmI [Nisaea acidiphila]UUX51443.1 c-type cytochrome biogenesis protein CcmI [Nisaea acidiphila]